MCKPLIIYLNEPVEDISPSVSNLLIDYPLLKMLSNSQQSLGKGIRGILKKKRYKELRSVVSFRILEKEHKNKKDGLTD
jgi:hypothetical protein